MELYTEGLILNPFEISDADKFASMAGDKRVVEMTASIPYPYTDPLGKIMSSLIYSF